MPATLRASLARRLPSRAASAMPRRTSIQKVALTPGPSAVRRRSPPTPSMPGIVASAVSRRAPASSASGTLEVALNLTR